MLSLSKRKTLKTVLKSKYSDSRRIKWWLKDESLIPVAQSAVTAIRDIIKQAVPPNIKIIKANKRKAVFRMEHSQGAGQSFVAKVFLLNCLRHRFKYHRYGLDEVANLLKAKDRGINTPEVYGYGHINDMLGLVKVSIIILEDLPGLSPIGALMRTKSQDECSRMLMRTIPLFISLYNAGCNHIDVNSGAIMLCEHNLNPAVFLLDFQHSKFYNKPSTEILMFEAGRFAKSCSKWVSTETINKWLCVILDSIGISRVYEKEKMRNRFDYYFGTYLSRKELKKIR